VFSNTEIVINKSLAGVKLYGSVEAGKKAWGEPESGDCDFGSCFYSNEVDDGMASFSFFKDDGRTLTNIRQISIYTGADKIGDVPAWLQIPKTSRGIGIGSSRKQIREAYPKAVEDSVGFKIERNGRGTYFGVKKFVNNITIDDLANCRTDGYAIYKRKNVNCDRAKTVTRRHAKGKTLPKGWSCKAPARELLPDVTCTKGKRSFKYHLDI
jgi:hypothetical protein